MTRIQRARALRLGFILPLLLWTGVASAHKQSAKELACADTAWLHYELAGLVGKNQDAAWEDAIETCLWAGTAYEATPAQRAAEKRKGSDACIASTPAGQCITQAAADRCDHCWDDEDPESAWEACVGAP